MFYYTCNDFDGYVDVPKKTEQTKTKKILLPIWNDLNCSYLSVCGYCCRFILCVAP